jgi:hypothetical protein
VPDLWDLVARLPEALQELRTAAGLDAPPELEHVPVLG